MKKWKLPKRIVIAGLHINGEITTTSINYCIVSLCRYPVGSEKRLQMYQAATGRLGSACYIEGALSSLMFLALEFAENQNAGLLANANCGGRYQLVHQKCPFSGFWKDCFYIVWSIITPLSNRFRTILCHVIYNESLYSFPFTMSYILSISN